MDKVIISSHSIREKLKGEDIRIILVNDGSIKGICKSDVALLKEKIPFLHYLEYEVNRGKGYAVRKGAEFSQADILLYTDIDFPYAEESVLEMIGLLKADQTDILFGIRDEEYYTHVPPSRMMVSKMLKRFTSLLIRIPFTDTQCGLKGFNRKGKEILLRTSIDRYLFDMEFICLASRNKNIRFRTFVVKTDPQSVFSTLSAKILIGEIWNFLKLMVK
jgi:glycosyltransferase involved in cell wall biosynthesis